MLQFGVVASGTSASAPIELRASDRAIAIGIASYGLAQWFLSAPLSPGGAYARIVDAWSVFSGGYSWVGAGGGWTVVPHVPTTTIRLEAGAAITAPVSFCLLEVAGS